MGGRRADQAPPRPLRRTSASYLVHAVLLHSKLAAVAVRGLGHVLQLLLLQADVLRRHRLAQAVDTGETEDAQVRRHASSGRGHRPTDDDRPSLDVLLMSRARHRLGPPALLLLRHVILGKTQYR